MKKILSLIYRIAEFGTWISLVGMIVAVVIQVVTRFLLPSAPSWTEELSRIFFIYSVGFGAAVGIRHDAFVKLELIRNYMTEKSYHFLNVIIYLCIILFSFVMIFYAWDFVQIGVSEQSPSLKIHMNFVFFSMVIMMFSITIFSIEKLLDLTSNIKTK